MLPYLVKCKDILFRFFSLGIVPLPFEPKLHHIENLQKLSIKEGGKRTKTGITLGPVKRKTERQDVTPSLFRIHPKLRPAVQ